MHLDTKEEQDLNEKTKSIMAVIYRSYIATEEEKKIFLEKDKEEFEKLETLKNEKYNPDDIFKESSIKENEEVKPVESNQEANIAIIKEENFFRKLISKIKMFFKNIEK